MYNIYKCYAHSSFVELLLQKFCIVVIVSDPTSEHVAQV